MPSVRRLSLTRWRSPHADRRIDEPAVREQAGGAGGVDVFLDAAAVAGERPLGEHGDVGNRVAEGVGRRSRDAECPFEGGPRDQLEGAQRPGTTAFESGEQLDQAIGVLDGQPPRLRRTRERNEIDDRPGDHTQRAPGADRQLGCVEAPAVLAQCSQ